MDKIRIVRTATFSALMTLMVASCAGNYYLEEERTPAPVISESDSEESNRVVVTGSRIRGEARSNRLARMAKAESERQISSDIVALEEKRRSGSDNKTVSWKPSTQAENNAVIKVGDKQEIKPEALDISVQIDGFRARVVIDGFYTNPHNRNLEGSFKFRLPDGAVPYFFAFGEAATTTEVEANQLHSGDALGSKQRLSPENIMKQRKQFWVAPKEAIMVSKEQAAYAYTDTVARQIDPALLEWSGAGVFSAKVFPLLPKKSHRVVIGYDVDLKRINRDLFFDLPVTRDSITKRINLTVNSKGAEQVLLRRVVEEQLQTAEKISKNNEMVISQLQGSELNGIRVIIQQHSEVALLGEDNSGSYFAKQWQVDLPEETAKTQATAVFALDTSLSASSEKFHLWVKLIDQILNQNQTEIERFAVLTFSSHNQWWKKQFIENNATQRSKLKQYLNQLALEGATDLSAALNQSVSPEWLHQSNASGVNRFDLFLLSDGAVTWGERDPFFISESLKAANQKHSFLNQLFTYRFGQAGENKLLLEHLVREIGGGSYYLDHDSDLQGLAKAHQLQPWTIQSIELAGASDILIAGRPKAVYPGQLLTFTGRASQTLGQSIGVSFSKGKQQRSVEIPLQHRIDSQLAARTYGQIAVSQLESISALQRKVASSFANHFRVPRKSSSLLMLESKADYQRYKIKPEEDAYVVSHRQVSNIFEKLASGFEKALADPKQKMKTLIEKLANMKNIQFSLPDVVTLLMEELPQSAFEIDNKNYAAKPLMRSDLPRKYRKKLTPSSINYEVVEQEAKRRYQRYSAQDGLKVVSSLVEQAPSDVAILRDVAFTAEAWGLNQQAYDLHLIAAKQRPFEPQSYTYLAKLADKLGNKDLALLYYEIGLASQWSNRFGDYALIHKIDYADFLLKSIQSVAEDSKGESNASFYAKDYAKLKLNRLTDEINLKGSKLIVAIAWNTDRTDIDLHVKEPSGEECYYSHNKTQSGGFITKDVTAGYGPEMYINKKAPNGRYDVSVNYYSSDRNKLGLKTKILIRTIKNWGTPEQLETIKTISLDKQKDKHRVAKIMI